MTSAINASSSVSNYSRATPTSSNQVNNPMIKKSGDGDGDHGQESSPPSGVSANNTSTGSLGSIIDTHA